MRNRRLIVQMVIAWAVAAGIGITIGLSIDWFPGQASSQADKVDTLYKVLIVACVPIFVLVETVVLFSVWKFRMRPGEEDKDGPPIHGNTRLEVLWTAVPAVLIISLCVYAYTVLRSFERKPSTREMDVDVWSQQFAWSFFYPHSVTGGQKVSSTTLVLPQGQPVRFHIHSADVIHAFYVPSFRLQIDAVPGQSDEVRATPNRLGNYLLECAELCGLGHSTMRATVHVVSPADFVSWLRSQGAPAPGIPVLVPGTQAGAPRPAVPRSSSTARVPA
ncbi:MAG TPA: cytochrome c oxidase subunit II [Solirubrobacteraceae bacterium]|jgi:cytochrome c oxidase subunit 2|nr:cytochrome c oxidase subunit II [Solirubrobacteraceae bacterium]